MFIDASHIGDEIIVWSRENGKLKKESFPAPYYLYDLAAPADYKYETIYKSLYGEDLVRLDFPTRKDFYNYVNRSDNDSLYESDIPAVNKFLSDNFYGKKPGESVNIGLFDIETEVNLDLGIGYPRPENPYGEINCISLFDVANKTYHMLVLDKTNVLELDLSDDECDVEIHYCVTEKQLLKVFLRLIKHIDVLSGWNSKCYDIPYIMERCKLYFKHWRSLLCRDNFNVWAKEDEDDYGNPIIDYVLTGRVHLDLMVLYKKFTQQVKPSYSLDAISENELGLSKVDYEGDLGELFRNDPQTFFEYALHDTRLLVKLEEKLQYLDLAKTMARQACIRYPQVLGSIKYLESVIRNYTHHDRDEMIILPDRDESSRSGKYEGAFVIDTKVGRYDWTASIDLASLYPSIIRSLNISPERYIYQLDGRFDDFLKVNAKSPDEIKVHFRDGTNFMMKAKDVHKMLRDDELTMTANGSILEHEMGLLPEVLGIWYEERKNTKSLSLKYQEAGDLEKYAFYNQRQLLMKINLNSLYGAVANVWSRFYELDLAASITLSAQLVNKFQIMESNNLIRNAIK